MTTRLDPRDALVARAEAALARGDAVTAAEDFERASAMLHSADIEMGLVRSLMQVGRYRRALALCAHVAGEHLDAPGAPVLYAWLLRIGGRRDLSSLVMREALERAPTDPVVLAGARALALPLPVASGPLLDAPHRVAPFATESAQEAAPPAHARVVSSGILLPGGSHVLVPRGPPSARLWVRDGLGATRQAVLVDAAGTGTDDPAAATVLYKLSTGMGSGAAPLNSHPIAGTPVYAMEFAEATNGTPAWPWLRAGFLGARTRDGGAFRLGVDLIAARAGGPVFDGAGRLLGTAIRDREGRLTLRPLDHRLDETPGADARSSAERAEPVADNLAFDELYDKAIRVAVQVIEPA